METPVDIPFHPQLTCKGDDGIKYIWVPLWRYSSINGLHFAAMKVVARYGDWAWVKPKLHPSNTGLKEDLLLHLCNDPNNGIGILYSGYQCYLLREKVIASWRNPAFNVCARCESVPADRLFTAFRLVTKEDELF